MKLVGVIVDWAGTIVDFGSKAPVEAFRAAFAAEGVPITVAEAREPMGLAKRDHISTITKMPRVIDAWTAAKGRAPAETDVDRIYHQFLPLQLEILLQHSKVIDGAIDALAAFRARGLKIGSTTGYVKELMDVLVPDAERQGLYVDAMFCPTDAPAGRPAPYMCWMNATRLGLYPMSAMVKIGDTVADVHEGLNAGMWTIALTHSGNEAGPDAERRLGRAHYRVPTIAEAVPILVQIEARMARGERP